MATPYKIQLGPNDIGNFHKGPYNAEAAAKVSEVLQKNLENWTIIFEGLKHNHIVHCILTIYSLGASPEEIQKVYDREASYQKKRYRIDEQIVESLADRETFKNYLGQQSNYSNYLLFFQREIEEKGVKITLEEHLFAGDDHANRLFALIYNGIFHPYLHLGYAFEYHQPAIVAEGLAMASVHDPEFELVGPIYIDSEKLAGGPRQRGSKTLRDLMEGLRANESLASSRNGDNKIDRSHNVAENAPQKMEEYAAQYSIASDQLEERVDESIDTASLMIATKPSPIKSEDPYKIDFFLLHSVNTLAMVPTLIDNEWITHGNAVRLMEWAGRCHLLNYVAQTAPPITSAEIDKYPKNLNWDEIFDRAISHPTDDGHLQKCVRSLAYGEQRMSKKYNESAYQIKPESWLRFANLVVDAVSWEAKISPQRWLLSFQDQPRL